MCSPKHPVMSPPLQRKTSPERTGKRITSQKWKEKVTKGKRPPSGKGGKSLLFRLQRTFLSTNTTPYDMKMQVLGVVKGVKGETTGGGGFERGGGGVYQWIAGGDQVYSGEKKPGSFLFSEEGMWYIPVWKKRGRKISEKDALNCGGEKKKIGGRGQGKISVPGFGKFGISLNWRCFLLKRHPGCHKGKNAIYHRSDKRGAREKKEPGDPAIRHTIWVRAYLGRGVLLGGVSQKSGRGSGRCSFRGGYCGGGILRGSSLVLIGWYVEAEGFWTHGARSGRGEKEICELEMV